MSSCIYILGNKINVFNSYESFYNEVILHKAKGNFTGYITVNNAHTMMEGYWDPNYQNIINSSYLSIPDGKPLQVVGKLKGNSSISRLFGPTVMEKFIDWGRNEKAKHFFIGGSEEKLQKLRAVISTKYSGALIVGMIAPPFKPIQDWNNDSFIRIINDVKPDFIWVGLGAPKQERWMFEHYKKINNGILFGIGAGFDYLAGNTKHAPNWMKDNSLEWMYRLIQEPKRLWKRYVTTIPTFIVFTTFELLKEKLKKK